MDGKLNIMDLLHIAFRWMILLIVTCVLGASVGFVYGNYFVKPTYTSKGNLYISSVSFDKIQDEMDNLPINVINASARLAADYVEIIEYESILKEVVASCDTEVTIDEVAKMLTAKVVAEDSMLIEVAVKALEPYVAYDIANAVLNVAAKRLPIVAEVPGTVTIVEEAREPVYSKASPIVYCVFSGIAGLFIGVLLMLVFELLDNRIKQTDDIVKKYNLPVLGIVPNIREVKGPKE